MQKNVASQKIGVQMVSATDGSAFTGSVTVAVTGDAGTQATGSVGSGACTHEGNGYHTYAPAQAETNYDLIAFTFTGTGAVPATVQVFTRWNANVTHLLGTAWLTPGTAGTPDVNAKLIGATSQTGRDLGTSVLLSSGTGTGQLDFTSGVVKGNVTQANGTAAPSSNGLLKTLPQGTGKTYYVAASGGNDSNSGLDSASPKATVSSAHTAANPGDTIWMLAGSYSDSGSAPFCTISKKNITLRGDGVGTVITCSAFDSGVWVTGEGCTVSNLKVVGTNVTGDLGIQVSANWGTVEDCDISTYEVGLSVVGDYFTGRRVKSVGGRYGLKVSGNGFVLEQCSGTTNGTFAAAGIGGSTSSFAGIYIDTTKTGSLLDCWADGVFVSGTSSGKLIGLSLNASPVYCRNLRINVANVGAGLSGGVYGVSSVSGVAVVGVLHGGSIAASNTNGTAKEIDASVSGSNIKAVGCFYTVANCLGTTNIHDDLEPLVPQRQVVVDAAGLVDSTAVKVGPTGSGTAQTAANLASAITGIPAALLATDNSGDTVGEQLVNLDAPVSEAGGGSGTPAQVHNTEPIPGLTSKLGTGVDGVMKAYPARRITPGKVTQIWVDCSSRLSGNIENVTNGASSDDEFDVSDDDALGMYGKYVSILVDAGDAEDGDTTTITCDVTPKVGQAFTVSVEVIADAL